MTDSSQPPPSEEPGRRSSGWSDPFFQKTQPLSGSGQTESRGPGTGEEAPESVGRYRIGGIIGQGGMAIVCDGHDTLLQRSVAVKVLRPELAEVEDMRQRFFYEAKLLSRLDHPGMIPVFEMGEFQGVGPYYAMKRIRGRTLREILSGMAATDFLRAEETARLVTIFDKVCQTMAYAHAQGLVHRDLKPENVMVDDYGVVLVLDWGLSKDLSGAMTPVTFERTEMGVIQGTPSYMSPEQASGQTDEVDLRSDVFALGIVLYEVLTGRSPFSAKTRSELLRKIINEDARPPRSVNRKASRVLSAICMKALCKDPDARYPSAKELAEDIRLYRNGMHTSAYKPGVGERLAAVAVRRPALTTGILTALVLIGASGAFGYHRRAVLLTQETEQARAEEKARAREREKQSRIVAEQTEKLAKVAAALPEIEGQILALEEKERALAAADSVSRAQVRARLAELRAVRNWYVELGRRYTSMLIVTMGEDATVSIGEVDSPLMDVMRQGILREVSGRIAIGDLYGAHNEIWRYIVEANLIGWDQADMAELLAMKGRVEAELSKAAGADVPLPDWEVYSPAHLAAPESLPQLLNEVSEAVAGGALPEEDAVLQSGEPGSERSAPSPEESGDETR